MPPRLSYRPGPYSRQSPLKKASEHSCHVPENTISERPRSLNPDWSKLWKRVAHRDAAAAESLTFEQLRTRSLSTAGTSATSAATVPADLAQRGQAIREAHAAERRVAARLQRHAISAVERVRAQLPRPAADDRRGCAVVEAGRVEVGHRAVHHEATAAVVLAFEQRDFLRRGHGGPAGEHRREENRAALHRAILRRVEWVVHPAAWQTAV